MENLGLFDAQFRCNLKRCLLEPFLLTDFTPSVFTPRAVQEMLLESEDPAFVQAGLLATGEHWAARLQPLAWTSADGGTGFLQHTVGDLPVCQARISAKSSIVSSLASDVDAVRPVAELGAGLEGLEISLGVPMAQVGGAILLDVRAETHLRVAEARPVQSPSASAEAADSRSNGEVTVVDGQICQACMMTLLRCSCPRMHEPPVLAERAQAALGIADLQSQARTAGRGRRRQRQEDLPTVLNIPSSPSKALLLGDSVPDIRRGQQPAAGSARGEVEGPARCAHGVSRTCRFI